MKKLLPFFIAVCFVAFSQAQCTIDTSITAPGFHPDTGTYLKQACFGSQYDETIQIYAPQNVTVSFGTYPVNYVRLDSIPDLPVDLHYATNPLSGTMNGGQRGCVNLYGLVNVPTGNYQFTIYYTANFNFNGTPISLGFIAPYKMHVDTGTKTYFAFNDTTCANSGYYFGGNWLNTTGTYKDTISNSAGCDSIITLSLYSKPFDTTVVVNANGDSLIAPTGYSNYQFIDCANNVVVQNSASNSFLIPSECCYAVVMNNNGCTDTSTCFSFVGIGKLNTAKVRLYPNPSNTNVTLDFGSAMNREILLTDVQGKTVQEVKSTATKVVLNAVDLNEGVYTVIIKSAIGYSYAKFIKTN
ncbi:MAG: T9SS type A sorting domain-containing protein [Chitinophagales bacterium]